MEQSTCPSPWNNHECLFWPMVYYTTQHTMEGYPEAAHRRDNYIQLRTTKIFTQTFHLLHFCFLLCSILLKPAIQRGKFITQIRTQISRKDKQDTTEHPLNRANRRAGIKPWRVKQYNSFELSFRPIIISWLNFTLIPLTPRHWPPEPSLNWRGQWWEVP